MRKIEEKLLNYHQEHLLFNYDKLSSSEQQKLLHEIENLDLDKIKKLYMKSWIDEEIDLNKITPLKYIRKDKLTNEEIDKYVSIGNKIILDNEYAIVTMAGGSGTRLGYPGPKGTVKLKLDNKEISLFEILLNQIKEANQKYNTVINWYIMTGKDNSEATINFFQENNYFNYPREKIFVFVQDSLPVIDVAGSVMLKNKCSILTSSNGNGDVFKSLRRNNLLSKMKEQKIKWLFFCSIDNILVKLIDPLFMGLTIANNYKVATKTLFKENVLGKDYIFCKYNNRPFMLPYKYITEDLSNKKDEKNEYLYREINITNHLISLDEVIKYSLLDIPYHRTFKKSNYYDDKDIEAEKPNSFKFEKYIFDMFYNSTDMLLYRVSESEFAPIKNKEGSNSLVSAMELYNKYNGRESR